MVLLTIPSIESMVDAMCSSTSHLRKTQASPANVVEDSPEPITRHNPSKDAEVGLKPFFIMDWLNEVEPKALQEAQKILGSKRNKGYLSEEHHQGQQHGDTSAQTGSQRRGDSLANKQPHQETSATNQVDHSVFHAQSVAIGNGYNAKGIQFARQGVWNEALACWESALQVRKQVLGVNHVDVANTHNNIGIALGKLQRFEEATAHLTSALDIRTAHYGEKHAEVAATLHNTGNVYQQAGDLSSALRCFCECKTLQEQIHKGLDHAEVARACIAIGHCYWEAESAYDAREAYLDALTIFHRIGRPENDPEVQATIEDIYELDQRILRETSVLSISQ